MINKLLFKVELAQWLVKQEYLMSIDEQISALEELKADLRAEEQSQLTKVKQSKQTNPCIRQGWARKLLCAPQVTAQVLALCRIRIK